MARFLLIIEGPGISRAQERSITTFRLKFHQFKKLIIWERITCNNKSQKLVTQNNHCGPMFLPELRIIDHSVSCKAAFQAAPSSLVHTQRPARDWQPSWRIHSPTWHWLQHLAHASLESLPTCLQVTLNQIFCCWSNGLIIRHGKLKCILSPFQR